MLDFLGSGTAAQAVKSSRQIAIRIGCFFMKFSEIGYNSLVDKNYGNVYTAMKVDTLSRILRKG